MGEPMPLEITIKNIGDGPVLPKSYLEFNSGGFYSKERIPLPLIEAQKQVKIDVELDPTGLADIDHLPEKILMTVYQPGGDIPHYCETAGIEIELGEFFPFFNQLCVSRFFFTSLFHSHYHLKLPWQEILLVGSRVSKNLRMSLDTSWCVVPWVRNSVDWSTA